MIEDQDQVLRELEHAGAGGVADGVSAVIARLRVALGRSDLPAAPASAFQPVLDELLILQERIRADQHVPEQHAGPATPGSSGAPQLRALGTLVRLSITSVDLREALHRVTLLSAEAQLRSVGQTWASVIVGSPQAPTLLTCSSKYAQGLEGRQLAAGEGPSYDAVDRAELITTAELCADQRWPRLRAAVHPNPTWCVAVPLLIDGQAEGVLSVYGHDCPAAVQAEAIGLIRIFAAAAQRLLVEARTVEQITKTQDQLEEALISRAVIDQAKGMIMMSHGCDADQAFQHLVRLSNARNQKLRDIAASLVAGTWASDPSSTRRPRPDQPQPPATHAGETIRGTV